MLIAVHRFTCVPLWNSHLVPQMWILLRFHQLTPETRNTRKSMYFIKVTRGSGSSTAHMSLLSQCHCLLAVQKELKTAFNIDIGKLRFVNGSNPGSWELFCIHRWANLHLLMANLCRPPSDLCSAIFLFMGILTFQFEHWWWLCMVLWQLMQIRIQIPIVGRRINQGKEVSDGQG